MAEIVIRDIQAEIRDEAVPALIDAANAIIDRFVSDSRTGEQALSIRGPTSHRRKLIRRTFANGQSFFLNLYTDVCTPVGLSWSTFDGVCKWGWGHYGKRRVPTTLEVEDAVTNMALIAEHFAVSDWKKKGKGVISRLRKIHNALV